MMTIESVTMMHCAKIVNKIPQLQQHFMQNVYKCLVVYY